jgi:hypothetical protein
LQERHNKLESTFKEVEIHYQEGRQALNETKAELEFLRSIKQKYDVNPK